MSRPGDPRHPFLRGLLGGAILPGLLALACGGDSPGPAGREAPSTRSRPLNVILVSLDTLRADRLGAYGHDRPTSPNFDAFASAAILFEDCLAASAHTVSSHKAIFSGRHPAAFLAAYSEAGGPPVPTRSPFDYYARAFQGWVSHSLAVRLRRAGYRTAAFTDGAYMRPLYGFTDGFETYTSRRLGLGRQRKLAEAWLEEHGESPFFLLVHCYDVHCPYDPPAEFLGRFEPSCEGRLRFEGACPEGYFNKLDLTGEEREHVRRHYDAGILHADHELGAFLGYLRRTGRFEDSVIVVTSDHGEALGERDGFFGHGRLHQDQLRVPLAIHVPGLGPGVVRAPVAGIDVAPTVLDLLRGDVPGGLDGWSMAGLMHGDSGPGAGSRLSPGLPRGGGPASMPAAGRGSGAGGRSAGEFRGRPRFAANTLNPVRQALTHLRRFAVVEEGRHKLILDAVSGSAKLYDLAEDPGESHDLAGLGRPAEGRLRALIRGHEPGPLNGLIGPEGSPPFVK
jgi:arylsulfatase